MVGNPVLTPTIRHSPLATHRADRAPRICSTEHYTVVQCAHPGTGRFVREGTSREGRSDPRRAVTYPLPRRYTGGPADRYRASVVRPRTGTLRVNPAWTRCGKSATGSQC